MTARAPLGGLTVVVTRPGPQAGPLLEQLEAAGANVLPMPALAISPVELDAAARARACPDAFDWLVFTSANAVREAVRQLPRPHTAQIAAVGRATAGALEQAGLRVDALPEQSSSSEGLLDLPAFSGPLRGRRVLILRGVGGRELLRDALRGRGAEVEVAELYRREAVPATAQRHAALERTLSGDDAVIVALNSVETLDAFLAGLGGSLRERLARVPLLLPAARVATAARDRGLSGPVILARGAEDAALVATLVEWWGRAARDARDTIGADGHESAV